MFIVEQKSHHRNRVNSIFIGTMVACYLIPALGYAGSVQTEARIAPEQAISVGSELDQVTPESTVHSAPAKRSLLSTLFYPAILSYQRMGPSGYQPDELEIAPRSLGDAMLPVLRLDMQYEYIDKDTDAGDFRVETGYGPVALSYRQTYYWQEFSTVNDLIHADDIYKERQRVEQLYLLYRMTFAQQFEIDMGVGRYRINYRDQESASLGLTLPLLFYPIPDLGIEFRPAWSMDEASDYELALLYGGSYYKARLGYRWARLTNDNPNIEPTNVEGVFAGLSLHF